MENDTIKAIDNPDISPSIPFTEQIWCCDLDGTLNTYPLQFKVLLDGILEQGHQVHVVTGHIGDTITPKVVLEKIALLTSLGLANSYNKLVIVADPKNHVSGQKVQYMKSVNATALIDNDKANIKEATKEGFLSLRVGG